MNGKLRKVWDALASKTVKKTIAYRSLSIITEFIGAYLITRNLEVPTLLMVWCIIAHTLIYVFIERRWK